MLFCLLILTSCGSEKDFEEESSLNFVPDAGYRTEGGIPEAMWSPEGTLYLYSDNEGEWLSTSKNGLDFTPAEHPTTYPYDARKVITPDGLWREYAWNIEFDQTSNPQKKQQEGTFTSLKSSVSYDGENYVEEPGIKYTVQESDEGWIGVYDVFTNCKDEVVLIYLADKYGLNNARMIVSDDGGQSFEFFKEDAFNDAQYGGGPQSFVDQESVELSDGTRLMFVMKLGIIYWLSSDCEGKEWTLEPGTLTRDDFPEFQVSTLHDPSAVINEDGSLRVYLGAFIEENGKTQEVILSAVAEL